MNQASVLFEFWPDDVRWFIVGGTALSDEAQTVHRAYPNVKCIGFEPNQDYVFRQNDELGFPGTVYPIALWSEDTTLDLVTPAGATPMSASVVNSPYRPDMGGPWTPGSSMPVKGRTLDGLSLEYGPFDKSVLWIDIEGAEYHALVGAIGLLSSGSIRLINLEAYAHINLPDINRFLYGYGFMLCKVWNIGTAAGRDAQDYVYRLETKGA